MRNGAFNTIQKALDTMHLQRLGGGFWLASKLLDEPIFNRLAESSKKFMWDQLVEEDDYHNGRLP